MLLKGGGEVVRGLDMALGPLILPEFLLLLLPFLSLVRWNVFIKLAVAGEKLFDQAPPGLCADEPMYGLTTLVLLSRWTCGVA